MLGKFFFAHDGFVYGFQETTGLNILSTAILLSGSNKYINIDSVIGASAGNWFVRLVDVSRRVVALGVILDAKTVAPISHVNIVFVSIWGQAFAKSDADGCYVGDWGRECPNYFAGELVFDGVR